MPKITKPPIKAACLAWYGPTLNCEGAIAKVLYTADLPRLVVTASSLVEV